MLISGSKYESIASDSDTKRRKVRLMLVGPGTDQDSYLMDLIIVGSQNQSTFAVSIFDELANVSQTSLVSPGSGGGCVVALSGTFAVVGDTNRSVLNLYDLTNPSEAIKQGSVQTTLNEIGSVDTDAGYVIAGELNGSRVALVDARISKAPVLVSQLPTSINGVGSVGLSWPFAVVSGANNSVFELLDLSNPQVPVAQFVDPGFAGGISIDIDGAYVVVGNQNGGQVALISLIGQPRVLAKVDTGLSGVYSVSISGSLIAASSNNNFDVSTIDFSNPSGPKLASFNPGLNGGSVVCAASGRLFAGAVLGTSVAILLVGGTSTRTIGTLNTGVASIFSIAVTTNAAVVVPQPINQPPISQSAPIIILSQAFPARLHDANHIRVSWKANSPSGRYVVTIQVSVNGESPKVENIVVAGGQSSYYDFYPATPLLEASIKAGFQVKGEDPSTDSSRLVEVMAESNTRSVRVFLKASGIRNTTISLRALGLDELRQPMQIPN